MPQPSFPWLGWCSGLVFFLTVLIRGPEHTSPAGLRIFVARDCRRAIGWQWIGLQRICRPHRWVEGCGTANSRRTSRRHRPRSAAWSATQTVQGFRGQTADDPTRSIDAAHTPQPRDRSLLDTPPESEPSSESRSFVAPFNDRLRGAQASRRKTPSRSREAEGPRTTQLGGHASEPRSWRAHS